MGILLVSVASLGGAGAASAETRVIVDVGAALGVAHDVRNETEPYALKQLPSLGLGLDVGAAGDHFDAGISAFGSWALLSPSIVSAGVFAGPALPLGPRARLSLVGELGWQSHDGLGNEYFSKDVQSSGVTLPYAGAAATILWALGAGRSATASIGLRAEARFDLEHGTGSAVVTPQCLGVLECLIGGDPSPFTNTYSVGGNEVLVGVVLRFDLTRRDHAVGRDRLTSGPWLGP